MFYIDPSLSSKLFKLIYSYSSIPSFFFSWKWMIIHEDQTQSFPEAWRQYEVSVFYFFKHILLYPRNESWEHLEECLFPDLFWDEIDGISALKFCISGPLSFFANQQIPPCPACAKGVPCPANMLEAGAGERGSWMRQKLLTTRKLSRENVQPQKTNRHDHEIAEMIKTQAKAV